MQNEVTAERLRRTAVNLAIVHAAVQAELYAARPQVDDLATITLWSDRTPARVIKVSPSGHQITLAELDARVVSGSMVDGSAKYQIAFHPRPDAVTQIATRRADGSYRLKGWSSGGRVRFGHADAYRDPSF